MTDSEVTEATQGTRRGRWWKIPLVVLASLVVLLLLAVAATQTGWFRNWVKGYVTGAANESLNGRLSIESLDGNLYSSLTLTGVALTQGQDTLIYVPRIDVNYDLWEALHHRIAIESVVVDRPLARLVQNDDSTWNLMQLVVEPAEQEAGPSEFEYTIDIAVARVQDGRIEIAAKDTLIPSVIDSLQMEFAGAYSSEEQQLDLRKLVLTTDAPGFSLIDLALKLTSDGDTMQVTDLKIRTGQNRFTGKAVVPLDDPAKVTAELECGSFNLEEYAHFLPEYELVAYPSISFVARLSADTVTADIVVAHEDQRVNATVQLADVLALAEDTTWNRVSYQLAAQFDKVVPGYWVEDESLNDALSGEIRLKGRGVDPEALEVACELQLKPGRIYGYNMQVVTLAGEYQGGAASATAKLRGDFGSGSVKANLSNLLDTPYYSLRAEMSNFDLAAITGDDSLASDLNFTTDLSGSGDEVANLRLKGSLSLRRSSLVGFEIDTAFAQLQFAGEFLTIDTAVVSMPIADFNLGGGLGMDKAGSVHFEADTRDLSDLATYLELDTLAFEGNIRGEVQGSFTDFAARLNLRMREVVYDAMRADSVYGNISLTVVDSSLATLTGDLAAAAPSFEDYNAKSLQVSGERVGEIMRFNASLIATDQSRLDVVSELAIDTLLQLSPVELTVHLPNQTWSGNARGLVVDAVNESYSIDSLRLGTTAENDTVEQQMTIDGTFSLLGNEDLRITARELSLAAIAELMQYSQPATGRLNLEANLKGTAAEPEFTANLDVRDGSVGEYSFKHLSGLADYAADSLNLSLDLIATETDTFAIDAHFPVNLSLLDSGEVFSYDRPFNLTARARRLPLASFKAFVPNIERATGFLSFELSASNTLRDPRATGSLTVSNASLKMPEYGIDYDKIGVDIKLESNLIKIKDISAHRGSGRVQITGELQYDSTIVAGEIRSTDFDLTAHDFYVTRHKNYEVQVNAGTDLSGPLNSATFGGKVTVLRSRIYLPAFTDEADAAELAGEPPMLVLATRPNSGDTPDTMRASVEAQPELAEERSEFYDNLRGRMEIDIPRNTWLRSPELKMEISGKVEVVKEGPEPELFGTISVVRGHYDVYGKRFVVDEGTFNFQGGVEMNPVINIRARHELRTAGREKKKLTIAATGTAEEPQLKFALDGTEISEGDAASYLAFGRSLDQLTYGERTELSGAGSSGGESSLASGLLASVVSSQITRALGNNLSVDVFDVKAQSDWKAATFVVGKYITNDLFVSYERAIGDVEDDDIAQQVVTLEYELTRIIYLQLIEGDAKASGFDIIFKWDNQKAF